MNEFTSTVRTVAVDLAKHVFQAAGEDARGQVVLERRLRSRQAFLAFLQALPVSVEVLLEVGPGAQAWARQWQQRGGRVRILPAQRVAEHRSGAKNDRNDALAILRAGRDRSIHAVPVKTAEQLALQALHRVRLGYVRRRTAIGNQVRGLLQEHGQVLARNEAALREALQRWPEDASVPIPDRLRGLIAELGAEWVQLKARIQALDAELAQAVRSEPVAEMLMDVRGIGPVTASALLCKQIDPARFASGRQLAAYFGLVPDQHSSGARVRLGRMSKRGDRYLRSLLLQGAHAVLRQVAARPQAPDTPRLQHWVQRHGRKGAAVRLANRNLRIVWRLLHDHPQGRGLEDAC